MNVKSPTPENLHTKLRTVRFISSAIMTAERLLLAFSLLFIWILGFSGLLLFTAPALSANVTNILSIIFYAGSVFLFIRGTRKIELPTREEIDRRLEISNRLKHRPLSFLKDTLANPYEKKTRDLWRAQSDKTWLSLIRLKPPQPEVGWAKRDRYAFRVALILLVIIGAVTAGGSWNDRLAKGFTPNLAASFFPEDRPVTLWVSPPDYTNLERQIYEKTSASPPPNIDIAEGSKVKVRAYSYAGAPSISITGKTQEMPRIADNTYEYETTLTNANSIRISQFFLTRAQWPITVITDEAPEIIQRKEPQETEFQALRFPLSVKDDYGVRTLNFKVTAAPEMGVPPIGEPIEKERVITTRAGTTDLQPVFDLTDHPWAGLPVTIELSATDYKKQTSQILKIDKVLPERKFEHPVAQKLVTYRKKLAWLPVASSAEVSRGLNTLLLFPEDIQHDKVVYLSLQSAAKRLEYNSGPKTAREVMELLWEVALKLEDGNLSLAMRALEDAHQDMSDAIQNPNLSDEEAKNKVSELDKALKNYLQEFSRELQKQQAEEDSIPRISPEVLEETLNEKAMEDFLDRLEDTVLKGDKNKAEELLSQLRDLMDVLDPSLADPLPGNVENMIAGVNELQQLIENLRDLKYQTEKLADKKEGYERSENPEDWMNSFETLESLQNLKKRQIERDFPPLAEPPPKSFQKYGFDLFPPPPQADPDLDKRLNPEKKKTKPLPKSGPEKLSSDNKKAQKTDKDHQSEYKGKQQEQLALRYVLGQLMKETGQFYGEIPENMGEAEFLMRDAEDLLIHRNATKAVPKQQEAIDKLIQAQKELSKKLQEMLDQQSEMAMGPDNLDPLGRQRPRPGDGERMNGQDRSGLPGSFVEIPDESKKRYVQDILKKLREKAGELERPQLELDYIDRLLEQF